MQPAAAQAAKGAGASEVARSRPCVGRQWASCKVMHASSPVANLQRIWVQARWVAGNGSECRWAATLVSQGKWGAGRRAAQAQQCGLAAAVPCTSGRAEVNLCLSNPCHAGKSGVAQENLHQRRVELCTLQEP